MKLIIIYKIATGYSPEQLRDVLQKTSIMWSVNSLTKKEIIIYKCGRLFLTLTYNANLSRQYFRAYQRKNSEGKIVLYGHFGIPLSLFLPLFVIMTGIARYSGGTTRGFLMAVLLSCIYLLTEIGVAIATSKSKRAIISFIESELTSRG